MEQKLAEFRARRRVEKVKMSEAADLQFTEQTAADTAVQSDSSQQPEKTETNQTAAHSSQNRVRKHLRHRKAE